MWFNQSLWCHTLSFSYLVVQRKPHFFFQPTILHVRIYIIHSIKIHLCFTDKKNNNSPVKFVPLCLLCSLFLRRSCLLLFCTQHLADSVALWSVCLKRDFSLKIFLTPVQGDKKKKNLYFVFSVCHIRWSDSFPASLDWSVFTCLHPYLRFCSVCHLILVDPVNCFLLTDVIQ